MAEYREYTVGHDGHFIGFEPLVCADDAEAIEQAKRISPTETGVSEQY